MARPGPSSCQSCRTKKLKCDRVQPCSNCNARAITCVFVTPPVSISSSSPLNDAGDIRKRLERLESLVLPREPSPESTPNETEEELQSLQRIGTIDDGLVSRNIHAVISLIMNPFSDQWHYNIAISVVEWCGLCDPKHTRNPFHPRRRLPSLCCFSSLPSGHVTL
jgi:hypothetical protein